MCIRDRCTFEVLRIATKLKKKVVIGTTGFTKKEEDLIKKFSKKIPILKAGNMSLGINLLMYLTEITSASLGSNYLSKVFEVHHKHKKDHPSGTALMLGRGIAVGKNKDFYKMIGKKYLNKKNFNRNKGEIIYPMPSLGIELLEEAFKITSIRSIEKSFILFNSSIIQFSISSENSSKSTSSS